jgi:hypothetical protein
MGWKYVMLESRIGWDTKVLYPVIFPDKLVHSQVAMQLRKIIPGWRRTYGVQVVSAGKIEHLEVEGLGGESETLGLKSELTDTGVIENYSYLHGIL